MGAGDTGVVDCDEQVDLQPGVVDQLALGEALLSDDVEGDALMSGERVVADHHQLQRALGLELHVEGVAGIKAHLDGSIGSRCDDFRRGEEGVVVGVGELDVLDEEGLVSGVRDRDRHDLRAADRYRLGRLSGHRDDRSVAVSGELDEQLRLVVDVELGVLLPEGRGGERDRDGRALAGLQVEQRLGIDLKQDLEEVLTEHVGVVVDRAVFVTDVGDREGEGLASLHDPAISEVQDGRLNEQSALGGGVPLRRLRRDRSQRIASRQR